jgi:monoamine oxidase
LKRRDFLLKFPLTAFAAVVSVETLLSKSNTKHEAKKFEGVVGIIGAGAAGMYAAKLLNEAKTPYKIFEASGHKGGRIKSFVGFGERPIELGAETIHGSKSVLYNFASKQKVINKKIKVNPKQIYFLKEGKVFRGKEILSQEGIIAALKFEKEIEKYKGEDISILDYLKLNSKKYPSQNWPLINAFVSNNEGSCISRMGMYSLAKETNRWHSGDDNFFTSVPLLELLQKEIGYASDSSTIYNCPIKEIDYSGNKITLINTAAEKFEVDKLIITVSLNVLKSSDIKFTPDLTEEKKAAFRKIGMDAGMKIIMKFKEPFVEGDALSIISDKSIPNMWKTQKNIFTSFVTGEKAEYLSEKGGEAEKIIMDELNKMFGNNPGRLLSDFYIQDWFKEPFIKGAYSYAAIGTEGNREILALPINNKIFFAGEATHTGGHNATVHGAMETGERAVSELLKTI